MKRRRDGGEPETGNRQGAANRAQSAPFKKQQHNNKRKMKLGGGGLSLEAFAAAKSKPLVNPAQIREQREFYKNAKKVQKYKKLVSQLGLQGRGVKGEEAAVKNVPTEEEEDSEMANEDTANEAPVTKSAAGFATRKLPFLNARGKQFKTSRKPAQQQQPKGISQMEKTREKFENKRSADEETRREREELYREQEQARNEAQRRLKAKQVRLKKKTKCGQPVMKHQIELLLETIQRGSS